MDSRNRIRHGLPAAAAVALLMLTAGAGCKMGAPDYTLTVVLPDDVTGSPPTGQYAYKELTDVSFSYAAVNPLASVEVFLNDKIRYPGSSHFTLYADGWKLTARVIDIRGTWNVTMLKTGETTATYKFTLTLTGTDVTSGAFTDGRGFQGTWAEASGILTLTYTDWLDFVLIGTPYEMGGTYSGDSTTGKWASIKAT